MIDEESGAVRVVDDEPSRGPAPGAAQDDRGRPAGLRDLGFNTAIARLTELNDAVTKLDAPPRAVVEQLVLMTSPLAPHIAEELWSRLGHPESLAHEAFPVADPAYLVDDTVTCVVQIKGKVRDRLEEIAPADISEDALRELVLALPRVTEAIAATGGVRPRAVVRAPKLVNVVPL